MQYIEHQVGDLVVSQRKKDGYISASKLTKAYERQTGKYRNPNTWFEKDRTNEYVELLSDKTGIEVYDLIQKRGEQLANIYPFDLLGKFRQWLQDSYIPEKFPKYVKKFVSSEECQLISEAIGYEIKPINKRLKPTSNNDN